MQCKSIRRPHARTTLPQVRARDARNGCAAMAAPAADAILCVAVVAGVRARVAQPPRRQWLGGVRRAWLAPKRRIRGREPPLFVAEAN